MHIYKFIRQLLMSKRIFPQSLKKHYLPIVENKINGYVASYKSIPDLKNGIKWCLEEMSNKEKIINSFVKSKFDTEKIVKSYLDFLNS